LELQDVATDVDEEPEVEPQDEEEVRKSDFDLNGMSILKAEG
jgi:hypothetical protein